METKPLSNSGFFSFKVEDLAQRRQIAIALLSLGILSIVGGVMAGIYTSMWTYAAIPIASGLITTSVAAFIFAKCCNANLTKTLEEQAEDNLNVALENQSLDPLRFSVIEEGRHQRIEKVGVMTYLFRCIFADGKEHAKSLGEVLNASSQALSSGSGLTEQQKITAAKYHRYTHHAPLFASIENLTKSNDIEAKFVKYTKDNHDDLTQPIYENGKWYYMKNQANHGLEAAAIFLETQAKRICRLLSCNFFCKYFSKDEKDADIYRLDRPQAECDKPTMQNIGHATVLFQLGKMNIITDPVFHDLNPLLYPRKTKPGLQVSELPPIDVVLISHNHRDHCDEESLRQLVPHQPMILCPRGDFRFFKDLGFQNVQEHDWWTTTQISKNGDTIDFHAVPARHWSGRGAFDSQESLICSWVFQRQGDAGALYFRGDTANIPEKTMNEIKGFVKAPIMVNLEPGGPNHTRVFMQSTHQSVLDSMMTCFQVNDNPENCLNYLIHHNAYELGTDRFDEALIIKDQILAFLESDLSYDNEAFKALPEFVQKELQDGVLAKIQGIGVQAFTARIKANFISPKIGERTELKLS